MGIETSSETYDKNNCSESSFWCQKKWTENLIDVILEENDGNFSSFPVPYNSNSHIQYLVSAIDGSEFTGEFSMMDIEGYPTNCYDYLMVVVDGVYLTTSKNITMHIFLKYLFFEDSFWGPLL